jgi:hypothetical protein
MFFSLDLIGRGHPLSTVWYAIANFHILYCLLHQHFSKKILTYIIACYTLASFVYSFLFLICLVQ